MLMCPSPDLIYSLSLHDALPISGALVTFAKAYSGLTDKEFAEVDAFIKRNILEKFGPVRTVKPQLVFRSEEHTSELQSPCNLVCRLLLEQKNTRNEHTVQY